MTTVGKYLINRLEQVGLKHIFGVPGDYVLGFFTELEKSKLKVVCNCNELNAGYAADAYARVNGVGAVCVTYGVGGLSLLNAVCGSFAERLPVIVISGAPKAKARSARHLLHHTIGELDLQRRSYDQITAACVVLINPEQAPRQIDETISVCLRQRRPVYIEIPIDIVDSPCKDPGPFKVDVSIPSVKETLAEAVAEAAAILKKAKRPVILAGVEPHRLGIRANLKRLVDHTGYPFVSTLLGKSVIREQHPQFAGVYGGVASWDSARKLVEKADVLLSLGALMTDIELGAKTTIIDPVKMITANSNNIRIKNHVYHNVSLKDFIDDLKKALPKRRKRKFNLRYPYGDLKAEFKPRPAAAITLRRFYQRLNRYLDRDNIVIAGSGDSIFSAANMQLPQGIDFIDQAFYLSIGFATPATLGVSLAAGEKRPVTFIGDGAFQMTAQEISTIIREKLNPIVFVMNNNGYLIERVMVDGAFNDLQPWQYCKLPDIFGGYGTQVRTEGQLEETLAWAKKNPQSFILIEVILDKWDCSANLKKLGLGYKKSLR